MSWRDVRQAVRELLLDPKLIPGWLVIAAVLAAQLFGGAR